MSPYLPNSEKQTEAPASRLKSVRRRRTPTMLQMEAVECGAASLGMILGFYQRHVPLEELRMASGVSRDGSKASNLVKAARNYGLDARGFKKELDDLGDIATPYIVFWNFNHFLVVEGFAENKVFLNDPAVGPRIVTSEEFDLSFTGVVLTFKPTASFQAGGQPRKVTHALASRLTGSYAAVLYLVIATAALVLPTAVVPVFSKVFVDSMLVSGKVLWVKPLLLAMTITLLLKGLLTFLQQYSLNRIEAKLSLTSSSRFLWHVLRLPINFFAQRFAGEIGSRVEINDRVAGLLAGELATNLVGILLVGSYAALMFQYDVLLTSISILIALVNVVYLRYIARQRTDNNLRLLQERGKLVGVSTAGLQMIEAIKSTGSESYYFSRWAGYQAKVVEAEQSLGSSTQLLASLAPFLLALNTVAILSFGGVRIIDGALTIGMLLAFQGLTASFSDPVNRLVDLGSQVQEITGDLSRLEDVLHSPLENALSGIENKDSSRDIKRLEGYVEVANLTFGYSPLEPPLIKDLSFTISPGQRLAIVGGSGSGKSTVAKLLAGLYEPWSGEIRFDGRRRSEYPREAITSSVSLVDQDIFLFAGTARDNLTMWDGTVEELTMVSAAMDAEIHDEIISRPGGYHARVEERGRNFSGGQCQRMELARAFATNPSVLILDEATSALDSRVEESISDHLRQRGCTCVIVAHRLSTVRDCDEIIVLDAGLVVQRGTHEALVAVEGPYSQLIKGN
jgi:NHLM bacteriocin system ABC transporter peptidase/ATP-binding protein